MNFCKQCGKELSEGTKFCGSCGAQAIAAEQQSVIATSVAQEELQTAKNAKGLLANWSAGQKFIALIIVAILCCGVYAKYQIPRDSTDALYQNSQDSADVNLDTSAAPTSTAPPVVEPIAPKPEWANTYLKCLELIGESKEKVVEEFGAPNQVGHNAVMFGGDMSTSDYLYEFKVDAGHSVQVLAFFNAKGTVSHIQSNIGIYGGDASAGKIWSALSDNDTPPLYYMMSDNWARGYWKLDKAQIRSLSPSPFAVVGYANGRLIQLTGVISEPALKGDRKFNTTTDQYDVGELYPNPNSTWKDARVMTLFSQPTRFQNSYSGEKYGDIHYISSEPKTSLGQPAATMIDANIVGLWQGTFSGRNADLQIQRCENNTFEGVLTSHESYGDVEIAVQGVLGDDNAFSFKGTKVIATPSGHKWAFGVNTGKFSDDKLSVSGVGKDPVNPVYGWNFTKKE